MSDAAPLLYARAIVEQRVNVCFCGVGDKQRALDKVCDVLRERYGACIARISVAKLACGRNVRRGLSLPRSTFLQPVAILIEHEVPSAPSLVPEEIVKMDHGPLSELLCKKEAVVRSMQEPPLIVLALDGIDREVLANDRMSVNALHLLSSLSYVVLVATADVLRGDVFRGVFWTFVRADTFVQHPRWKLSIRAIPDPTSEDLPPASDVHAMSVAMDTEAFDGAGEDDAMRDDDGAARFLKHLSRFQVKLLRLVDSMCAASGAAVAFTSSGNLQDRGRIDLQSVTLRAKKEGLFRTGARVEENMSDLVRAGVLEQCSVAESPGLLFWRVSEAGLMAIRHLEQKEAAEKHSTMAESSSESGDDDSDDDDDDDDDNSSSSSSSQSDSSSD